MWNVIRRPSAAALVVLATARIAAAADACSPVMEWNQNALRATTLTTPPQGALVQIRSMAIVHASMHDAVNSITMREAPVNCRPTKMQANSIAKSAPASKPAGSVPSESKSGIPRARAQATTSNPAASERLLACKSGGISASASFVAT